MPERRHRRLTRRGAFAALALAAALLAGATPPAASQEADASITEAFTITNDSANPPKRFEAFDASAVGVFDLDGDGVFEIIAHNDNNRAYVFDGGTGELVAEIQTTHPGGDRWGARELNGIAVGDVNGNRVPDLVIANGAGYVTAFEARPPPEPPAKLEFVKLWETLLDPTLQDPDFFATRPEAKANWTGFPGLDGAAFVADVDGDGKDEVFAQLDNVPSHYALESDGSVMWWNDRGDGNGNPVADDMDKDGSVEVAFATDGGRVLVYDAASGRHECTFDSKAHGIRPASITVSPRVVDLDGDGKKEMVFGARQAVEDKNDPEWFRNQHAGYFAITPSCSLVWKQQFDFGNPLVYMHPAPVDIDGDGKLDLVFHDWNTIGHKPGNWEVTGKARLFAVKGTTGELIWQIPVDTYWSNKDIAIADVVGDDEPEILAVAGQGGEDGVVLVSLSGEVVGFVGAGAGWQVSRGPAVQDLDGDGTLEIMLPIYRGVEGCTRELDVGCREGALKVYHTGKAKEPEWDGIFLYSRAYDYLGEDRRAPAVPEISVGQPEAPIGVVAIEISGEEPSKVFAKRVGTTDWFAMDAKGGGRFEATVDPAPTGGETFFVRVTLANGQVAYATIKWEGKGDGRLEGYVTQMSGKPLGGARVTLTRDGSVVEEVTTGADGAFAFDLPPGRYEVTASADGRDTKTEEADVRPAEVTRIAVRLPREGQEPPQEAVIPVPGAALVGTLLAVVAAVATARRRRP